MLSGILLGALIAPSSILLWIVIGFGTVMAVVGFVDDVRSLSARSRFAAQLLVGLLLGVAVMKATDGPWWGVGVAALLFAGFVNMANFMDGANGVSSLYGSVAGLSFVAIGLLAGEQWLVITGALVGVSYLMFLPWNTLGAGMFLGDCGSYLLGGLVAAMAIGALASGLPWPAALAPLAIYITDTSATILTRVARREKWWEAHRQHLYQRMIDAGMPHVVVAGFLAIFTLFAAAAGAVSLATFPTATMVAFVAVIACCLLYVGTARTAIRTLQRTA